MKQASCNKVIYCNLTIPQLLCKRHKIYRANTFANLEHLSRSILRFLTLVPLLLQASIDISPNVYKSRV